MKKFFSFIVSAAILICAIAPFCTLATDNTPSLKSISFNGATIDGEFSSDVLDYTITLDDPIENPTLKSYEINGSANIFVTYSTDKSKHSNGIVVKLEHNNGAVYYNFKYSNIGSFDEHKNADLKEVSCNLGEVYPKINYNDTSYRLYIPADLTEINLSAAAHDVWATVDAPSSIKLNTDQEPVIPITVTSPDGTVKNYKFKVKRLKKTSEEVKVEMADPNFKSIVYGELLYQRPEFIVAIVCAIVGLIIVLASIRYAKRIMIKVGDDEEEEFFQ